MTLTLKKERKHKKYAFFSKVFYLSGNWYLNDKLRNNKKRNFFCKIWRSNSRGFTKQLLPFPSLWANIFVLKFFSLYVKIWFFLWKSLPRAHNLWISLQFIFIHACFLYKHNAHKLTQPEVKGLFKYKHICQPWEAVFIYFFMGTVTCQWSMTW